MNPIKVFLLAFVLFFAVDGAMAQTSRKEQRKIEKAERKRLKEEAKKKNQELIMSLVEDQAFVLETYSVFNRYMDRTEVVPSTNFIQIVGDQLTIQTGNNFRMGYNGLGGITLEGTIREYKMMPAKNGKSVNVLIQFSNPLLGYSTMNLQVNGQGNASARVTDSWGRRATFQGQMSTLEDTIVYKGGPAI